MVYNTLFGRYGGISDAGPTIPASLYLPFNVDFNDRSGNGHTGTGTGTAALSTDQSKFGGKSLKLDGNSDFVTYANSADFQFGADDFTIEAYVYQENAAGSDPADRHPIVSRADAQDERSFHFGIVSSGGQQRLQFSFTSDGSQATQYEFYGDVTVDNFHLVAVVRSGVDMLGFVNGTLLSSSVVGATSRIGSASIHVGTSDLEIGHRGLSNQFFDGFIDEVRIVKGTAVYTGNFTPPGAHG